MVPAIDQRVANVTGGGTGIGRAAALALLEAGYAVAVAGRRAEALAETRALAGDLGANARPIVSDVTEPRSVARLFDAVVAEFGRLDLLFNNAGSGAPPVPLEELSLEQWQAVVDVNLTGSFLCTQEAFRIMKRQSPMGGRIINNGSLSADRPRPNRRPTPPRSTPSRASPNRHRSTDAATTSPAGRSTSATRRRR